LALLQPLDVQTSKQVTCIYLQLLPSVGIMPHDGPINIRSMHVPDLLPCSCYTRDHGCCVRVRAHVGRHALPACLMYTHYCLSGLAGGRRGLDRTLPAGCAARPAQPRRPWPHPSQGAERVAGGRRMRPWRRTRGMPSARRKPGSPWLAGCLVLLQLKVITALRLAADIEPAAWACRGHGA
jgi:hypothetical protein